MARRRWSAGSVGLVEGGPYDGMYVEVERATDGCHIWLLTRHPDAEPSEGWGIWADTEDDVEEWLASDLAGSRWLGVPGRPDGEPPAG